MGSAGAGLLQVWGQEALGASLLQEELPKHTVPLKILALGGWFLLSTQGRCLVLQHHLGGRSVPGAMQYCFWGDRVLGLSRRGRRHLTLCFIFLCVNISHRKAKVT